MGPLTGKVPSGFVEVVATGQAEASDAQKTSMPAPKMALPAGSATRPSRVPGAMTSDCTVAVVLAPLPSTEGVVTVAVFVTVAAAGVCTVSDTVAEAPVARFPSAHGTVPAPSPHQAC